VPKCGVSPQRLAEAVADAAWVSNAFGCKGREVGPLDDVANCCYYYHAILPAARE